MSVYESTGWNVENRYGNQKYTVYLTKLYIISVNELIIIVLIIWIKNIDKWGCIIGFEIYRWVSYLQNGLEYGCIITEMYQDVPNDNMSCSLCNMHAILSFF